MDYKIISKYFTELSPRQMEQFQMLGTLYPEWNQKINVISRKDIDNLYVNHILHSLSIAKFITPIDFTRILDMGTGGGLPGIPLAIMFPKCQFHLIDRIGKKIKVANSIADEIGLENVTFQHGDIGECHEKFDFVVSRAVMRLDELISLVRKNILKDNKNAYGNGVISLKGGDIESESGKYRGSIMEFDLNKYFEEPFFDTKKLVYVPV